MREPSRDSGGSSTASIDSATATRPRVLYLSCHLPWPAISGGRRRELELIKRTAARFDVHLLVISKTPEQDLAHAFMVEPYCMAVEVFRAIATDGESFAVEQAPQVLRHRCPAATQRVREILDSAPIDLVHVEGFYLMQHLPEWTPAPILLVEQNIEFDLERQRAKRTGSAEDVARLIQTAVAERACWARATRLAAVTAEDRDAMEATLPGKAVEVVPDGADHVPHLRVVDPDHNVAHPGVPLLVLLANFGYAPNVDAALHFCTDILPLIRTRVPDVRLWLVGNAPPPAIRGLRCDHIEVSGRVPDVLPYLDAADAIVCPLRIGGGIKVKTIEALRRGKAIVSTSIGAQGLPQRARDALAIADEPRAFAEAATGVLTEPGLRASHQRRAARTAAELPTWDQAADALDAVYDDLLGRAPAGVDRREARAVAGGSR